MYIREHTHVYEYIAGRDIRSATETGVLVTWPNIIDLPHPVHVPNLIVDGAAPGRVTQGRICYVRTRVHTRRNVLPICAYVHTRDALAAFPPTREFNTAPVSRSIAGILADCVSRGKSLALSPAKLTKGNSRRARFTCRTSERSV